MMQHSTLNTAHGSDEPSRSLFQEEKLKLHPDDIKIDEINHSLWSPPGCITVFLLLNGFQAPS